jgi:quercetin dioxygenase-like cupin family protein
VPTDKARILSSQVLTTAELVSYQPGAVVSRTLIDKQASTVTVFAFDAGQGLSEHSTPFDALVQVVDGEAEITLSGTPHVVAAGQLMIMPANQPHAVRALTPVKLLLIMSRG